MGLRTLKRRRRENKTDYRLRYDILKSDKPRIVIRKTSRYIVAQVVESNEAQDKVVTGVTSKDLIKEGWDEKFAGSLKSVPAAYLTGVLLGNKVKKGNFIIDLGMARNIAGSRVYAVIKGLIDSGLNIKADAKIFPPEDRLNGKHMEENVQKIIAKVKAKLGGKSK